MPESPRRNHGFAGAPPNRYPAADLCRERQWQPGVKLVSDEWGGPVEIVEVGPRHIYVKRRYGFSTSKDRVSTFPLDVRAT